MSAEATSFVWKYGAKSGMSGNHLLVMLALAHQATNRKSPFISQMSFTETAAMCGISKRHVIRVVSEMVESGHLQLICKGKGRLPSLYGFGRRRGDIFYTSGGDTMSLLREDSTEVA